MNSFNIINIELSCRLHKNLLSTLRHSELERLPGNTMALCYADAIKILYHLPLCWPMETCILCLEISDVFAGQLEIRLFTVLKLQVNMTSRSPKTGTCREFQLNIAGLRTSLRTRKEPQALHNQEKSQSPSNFHFRFLNYKAKGL